MDAEIWQIRKKKVKEIMVTNKGKINKKFTCQNFKNEWEYIKIWYQKKSLVLIKQILTKTVDINKANINETLIFDKVFYV